MNIYRVTNTETNETYERTTFDVMDKFYITHDSLIWHANNKSDYCGLKIEKIGVTRKTTIHEVNEKKKTEGSLDDDLKQATKCGLSYGQWKLLQAGGK